MEGTWIEHFRISHGFTHFWIFISENIRYASVSLMIHLFKAFVSMLHPSICTIFYQISIINMAKKQNINIIIEFFSNYNKSNRKYLFFHANRKKIFSAIFLNFKMKTLRENNWPYLTGVVLFVFVLLFVAVIIFAILNSKTWVFSRRPIGHTRSILWHFYHNKIQLHWYKYYLHIIKPPENKKKKLQRKSLFFLV